MHAEIILAPSERGASGVADDGRSSRKMRDLCIAEL